MAKRYDLEPLEMVDALVKAWRNKTVTFRSLKIIRREVNQDFTTFLITKKEKIASQFRVELDLIKNPEILKNDIQYVSISNYRNLKVDQKLTKPNKKIGNLRVGMKRINVKGKITEIPPVHQVFTRFGNQSYVSNVKIADETGTIRLSLWNKQIEKVHVEDKVEITNGYVSSFAGEPQLRIGRTGTMSVID